MLAENIPALVVLMRKATDVFIQGLEGFL